VRFGCEIQAGSIANLSLAIRAAAVNVNCGSVGSTEVEGETGQLEPDASSTCSRSWSISGELAVVGRRDPSRKPNLLRERAGQSACASGPRRFGQSGDVFRRRGPLGAPSAAISHRDPEPLTWFSTAT
jgi:hypothetical protein